MQGRDVLNDIPRRIVELGEPFHNLELAGHLTRRVISSATTRA
jgi:hypothetical protein